MKRRQADAGRSGLVVSPSGQGQPHHPGAPGGSAQTDHRPGLGRAIAPVRSLPSHGRPRQAAQRGDRGGGPRVVRLHLGHRAHDRRHIGADRRRKPSPVVRSTTPPGRLAGYGWGCARQRLRKRFAPLTATPPAILGRQTRMGSLCQGACSTTASIHLYP